MARLTSCSYWIQLVDVQSWARAGRELGRLQSPERRFRRQGFVCGIIVTRLLRRAFAHPPAQGESTLDTRFWLEKWQHNEIGFHLPEAHPLLRRYLPALSLEAGARLCLPLCGKTLDIPWLLSQGMEVVGSELSELAVSQFFEELGVDPATRDWRAGTCFSAPGLTIYQGDFFELTAADLGRVDAVYDRAALVALPAEMRARYAAHLLELTGAAQQLLISFEYDQSRMNGPPFAVPGDEIRRLYGDQLEQRALSRKDIINSEGKFRERGLESLVEVVWHLAASGR